MAFATALLTGTSGPRPATCANRSSASVAGITATIDTGEAGEDAIRRDVDHMAELGLVESDGEQVRRTPEGEAAASRLP